MCRCAAQGAISFTWSPIISDGLETAGSTLRNWPKSRVSVRTAGIRGEEGRVGGSSGREERREREWRGGKKPLSINLFRA